VHPDFCPLITVYGTVHVIVHIIVHVHGIHDIVYFKKKEIKKEKNKKRRENRKKKETKKIKKKNNNHLVYIFCLLKVLSVLSTYIFFSIYCNCLACFVGSEIVFHYFFFIDVKKIILSL